MRRSLYLLALAAFLPACNPAVSLRLTLSVPETVTLDTSGGYEIDLLAPDGTRLPNIETGFVAFQSGAETVGVRVIDDSAFGDSDTLNALLFVKAVPSQGAAPVAVGAEQLVLTRAGVSDVTIELRADPRPVTGTLDVRLGTDWTAVDRGEAEIGTAIVVEGFALADEGLRYDLWIQCTPACDDDGATELRVGTLDGTTGVAGVVGTEALYTKDVTLAVKAVPDTVSTEIGAGIGWTVARGGVPDAVLTGGLTSILDPDTGYARKIELGVGWAVTHAGFAGTASAGDTDYARSHTFHALFALVSVPDDTAPNPPAASQNNDGDDIGLLDATLDATPGYLTLAGEAATAAAEAAVDVDLTDPALALRQCLSNIRTAADAARTAGLAVDGAADPVGEAVLFKEAVDLVEDALLGTESVAVPCATDLAEGLTLVPFDRLAKGAE